MPYKDKAVRREYQRKYRRRQRAGLLKSAKGSQKKVSIPTCKPIETAQDLKECLADQIVRVMASKTEELAKARVTGYLCGILLRVFETVELSDRVSAIERKLENTGHEEAVR